MRRFFKVLSVSIVFILMVSVTLDFVYTYVFTKVSKRTVLSRMREVNSYDFIVIGSSRALHHVNTQLISDSLHLKCYNFGLSASEPAEHYLLIKKFFEYGNSARYIFIQVDNSWESEEPSALACQQFIPAIRDTTLQEYFSSLESYYELKYLPFYRYTQFRDIGWRELLKVAILNRRPADAYLGFDPMCISGFKGPDEYSLHLTKNRNEFVVKTEKLIAENNAEVIWFTSPMFKNVGSNPSEFFKARLKTYYDFSTVLPEKKFFMDASHLNCDGANEFTRQFVKFFNAREQRVFTLGEN